MIKKMLGNMNAQQKHSILRMGVSILIGLGLATLLIILTSDKPADSLRYYFTAPLTNLNYFSYWIQKTIPIIFTGVASASCSAPISSTSDWKAHSCSVAWWRR